MRSHFRAETWTGALLFGAVLIVYLLTLSPTVTAEDCGELAAAAATLGVAHPTGYPLFILLERTIARLPLEGRMIWKLNLSGAVLCSVAAFLFFRLFLFLLGEKSEKFLGSRREGDSVQAADPFHNLAAAAIAALSMSFWAIFWSAATSLEVYALHMVFLALAMRLFLGALWDHGDGPGIAFGRRWALFSFVLGLGFTNHMMMVLLAPAFLFLYFRAHGLKKPAWMGIAKAAPPFLLGLTVYLYVPMRSLQSPLMNWGDPSTPKAFWQHLTAAQYRGQMFSSLDVAVRKLAQFSVDLPPELGHVPLAAALAGLWALYGRFRVLLHFSLLLFFACVVYAVNYAFDDRNFYLNAYPAIAIWIAFGVRAILASARGAWLWPARFACAAVFLSPLILNFPRQDKSRDYSIEDYAKNVLNSMDSGAVLFTNEYERVASPAFYLQQVEGFRPDIATVDIILLGSPWYYKHLEALHPWLIRNSRPAIDAYLAALEKFRPGGFFDTAAYNDRTVEMFRTMIARNYRSRSVYVSAGVNPEVLKGYRFVPSGLVFRIWSETDSAARLTPVQFDFRPLPSFRANPLAKNIRDEYASAYGNQGVQRILRGDTAAGVADLRKALALNPDFPEATQWLRDVGR